MFNNSTGFTMPVQPAYCGNTGNGMFGDGSWWVILILFALFGGWGNGGFGGFGGNGGVANEVQRGFDNQSVLNKLNGLENGLCDGFYSQNTTMLQGFNGLQQSIMGGFHGVDNAICNLGYNVQSGFNSLGHQISDCCCATQRAIDGVNYNMATQACETRQAIATSTRDIIDNQNANSRQLLDFLVNDKLATLQAENQSLRLSASQAEQNAVLKAAIDASTAEVIRRTGNECPIPAYVVPNPNCCYNPFGFSYGSGYGNSCGCGCS